MAEFLTPAQQQVANEFTRLRKQRRIASLHQAAAGLGGGDPVRTRYATGMTVQPDQDVVIARAAAEAARQQYADYAGKRKEAHGKLMMEAVKALGHQMDFLEKQEEGWAKLADTRAMHALGEASEAREAYQKAESIVLGEMTPEGKAAQARFSEFARRHLGTGGSQRDTERLIRSPDLAQVLADEMEALTAPADVQAMLNDPTVKAVFDANASAESLEQQVPLTDASVTQMGRIQGLRAKAAEELTLAGRAMQQAADTYAGALETAWSIDPRLATPDSQAALQGFMDQMGVVKGVGDRAEADPVLQDLRQTMVDANEALDQAVADAPAQTVAEGRDKLFESPEFRRFQIQHNLADETQAKRKFLQTQRRTRRALRKEGRGKDIVGIDPHDYIPTPGIDEADRIVRAAKAEQATAELQSAPTDAGPQPAAPGPSADLADSELAPAGATPDTATVDPIEAAQAEQTALLDERAQRRRAAILGKMPGGAPDPRGVSVLP